MSNDTFYNGLRIVNVDSGNKHVSILCNSINIFKNK